MSTQPKATHAGQSHASFVTTAKLMKLEVLAKSKGALSSVSVDRATLLSLVEEIRAYRLSGAEIDPVAASLALTERKPRTHTVFHMGVDKHYLIRVLREDEAKGLDWRRWLVDVAADVTIDDACRRIQEDPRNTFCSCECAKNEDGSCAGSRS